MMRMIPIAALAAVTALPCRAQYPDRPVTMLAGFPPGGLVDIVARVVAEGMKPGFPKGIVEARWDVGIGVWYLIAAPKGTPAPALKHVHDAAKAAIDDGKFVATMTARGVDVDYRAGEALRADLWKEYQALGAVLRRIGSIK